jgi:predicted nucleic acid-binding protein
VTKQRLARRLLGLAAGEDCVLANQVIAESFHVVIGKLRMPVAEAATLARGWMTLFPGVEGTSVALERAITEAEHGRLSIWDARLLATVEEAGCTTMLSEDMQDGMRLGNIVVRNPFTGTDLSVAAKQLLGL